MSIGSESLAGAMMMTALVVVMLEGVGVPISRAWAGGAYWIAALLLWTRLARRNRRQSLVLLCLGLLGVAWGFIHDLRLEPVALLSGNTRLISMLVAVSFLGLVSRPGVESEERLPRGRHGIGATLLGVHLFGSVINLSAVFILGDRLSLRGRLNRRQALVLNRGFSAAAFWSPFFAAMAVALSVAPGAKLSWLIPLGLLLALLAMGLTYWEVSRLDDQADEPFVGYPMHFGSLWLPFLLALGVLAIRHQNPNLSILTIITLIAPCTAILVLLLRQGSSLGPLVRHIKQRLPQMGNEVTLFLAAGVLGYGLESVVAGLGHWQFFDRFGALEAAVCFIAILIKALLGVHPIISIAFWAAFLAPLEPDPTLLSLVCLASWSLGSAAGPLSGMNLAMQGRYGIEAHRLMCWNMRYLLLMSLPVLAVIYTVAPYLVR